MRATPTYTTTKSAIATCLYRYRNGPDKDKLCAASFIRSHPDQEACPVHAVARRDQLQRERTAANRAKKKKDRAA